MLHDRWGGNDATSTIRISIVNRVRGVALCAIPTISMHVGGRTRSRNKNVEWVVILTGTPESRQNQQSRWSQFFPHLVPTDNMSHLERVLSAYTMIQTLLSSVLSLLGESRFEGITERLLVFNLSQQT